MERPKLMAHQERGVEWLDRKPMPLVAVLLEDRGVGKTAQALVALSRRIARQEIRRILYVAPLSTLENVKREAVRFTDNLKPQVVYGSRQARARMISNPGDRNLDIVNYDALRILAAELMQAGYDAIVADESTKIKARQTQVARVATMLGSKARLKILATGMPFTEGVEDAWSQFNFLDPSILGSNFYGFQNRYCVTIDIKLGSGRKFRKIVKYKNLAEFEDRIAPHVFRVAKEDCLDLPPKTFEVVRVPMLEEQARMYAAVERQVSSEIGLTTITHVEALAKIQKLRQIAAGFVYDHEHEPVIVPSGKYDAFTEFLDDTLYGSQKAVVFTSFRAEPEMVEQSILGMKKKIEVRHLPENPVYRQGAIDSWAKHSGSPAVLVANVRSGGVGLNLAAAHAALFLSNDWRMEDRAQAVDRVHRIGSEVHKKILIADFVTVGTIEEDILEALDSKQEFVGFFLERMRRRQNGQEA